MMSGIKSKNTKPEILVRQHLYSLGFRYRLNLKINGIKPDIVLIKWKCCIFVNGCFWHRHKNCKLASLPKSNVEFWKKKFDDNISRDLKNKKILKDHGWSIGEIWECAIRNKKFLKYNFKSALLRKSSWIIE